MALSSCGALCALTIVSWLVARTELSAGALPDTKLGAIVLALAGAKGLLILFGYMGVGRGPRIWPLLLGGWTVLLTGALIASYLRGAV
ncbi:MAG: cytochrome C oxidase subunit IV family protein [Pseudomonadota bacterium]